METTHTTTATAFDTYLLPFAAALLQYTTVDKKFAESFATLLQDLPTQESVSTPNPAQPTTFITPRTREEATELAVWLYQQLVESETRTAHTRGLLTAWANEFEAPKDQIFGFVGIAIIGPTLGLIKSKKKKRGKMQVVILKKQHERLSATKLATLVLTASQELVARELRLVSGNVYRLHPDTAAWCLEEAATNIYTANEQELYELHQATQQEKLSHIAKNQNGKTMTLVVSPAVNDAFVKDYEVEVVK